MAVRNVRRDGMEHLKRMEKDGDIGKDEHHMLATKVQELTDTVIKEIDETLTARKLRLCRSSWRGAGPRDRSSKDIQDVTLAIEELPGRRQMPPLGTSPSSWMATDLGENIRSGS